MMNCLFTDHLSHCPLKANEQVNEKKMHTINVDFFENDRNRVFRGNSGTEIECPASVILRKEAFSNYPVVVLVLLRRTTL